MGIRFNTFCAAEVKRRIRRSLIQHDKDHVHRIDQIGEVAVCPSQLRVAVLQLVIDGDQLLVGGLQLLLGGFQLFVGALQLLVAGENFFVGRLQLLVGGFLFFNDGAQIVLRPSQLSAQRGEFARCVRAALALAVRGAAAWRCLVAFGAVSNKIR